MVELRGNLDHPITAGFLCKNTTNYLQNIFYSSKRVLHPIFKKDGRWRRISWDEALNIITLQIKDVVGEYGSQAILYYQGFGARTALQFMNKRFFNLLGGVTTTSGTVCGGIGHHALEKDFGIKIPHHPLDHLNSNLIIIWGRNPAVTDVHLWKILRRAKHNGTKLVVVDPVKSKTAKQADMFIQPAPGTDYYLAMALIKVILENNLQDKDFLKNHTRNYQSFQELVDNYSLGFLAAECDVSIEKLEQLAWAYSQIGPSSIVAGWGVHRYKQGHLALHMMNALAAVTGNIGISGSGVTQGFEEYEYFNRDVELEEVKPRKLPMAGIGEAILKTKNPPIKLIFITSGNPVNLSPNSRKVEKAFKKVDFVVMIDHFLNDTSDVADLFLPATTFLEEEDLMGSFGHSFISPVNRVISPRGEAKSEFETFQMLSEKLGFAGEMAGSPRRWLEMIASPIINKGYCYDELRDGPVEMVGAEEIPFEDKIFPTESGFFEFNTTLDETPKMDESFPLHLLSTSPEKWLGSVIPENEMENGFLEVLIHPNTLETEGMEDGETVILESSVGKLKVKVKKSEDVRTDSVLTYKGGWMKYNKNINVLTLDHESLRGEGTPYYDSRVRIKKIAPL